MKTVVVLAFVLALSACGGRQVLKPQPGASLPPKPEFAATVPTAEQLMTPEDQSRPKRSDELLLKSEKRRDDKFDLPPTG
jgi:hypothetical protein